MRRDELGELAAFAAVAEERSFTRAAARLGLSQSTLSQTVSVLEARLGLRLLARTTRSVRPTEAGQDLLETLIPAFRDIDARLLALAELRDRPSGTIKLTTVKSPYLSIILPKLTTFLASYPDVKVEVIVDDKFTDIVAAGFDAGIRFGGYVEKDMVSVPIGPDVRAAVVAAPSYWARFPMPKTPHDLAQHDCINFRTASAGGIFHWRFWDKGKPIEVKVCGRLTVNDGDVLEASALAGQGLAYLFEDQIDNHIRSGRLVPCLEAWCPPFPGYALYYASRKHKPAALSSFVDHVRYRPDCSPSKAGAAPR
jgi:DNA-binding transcriptional LysR family regulator